ncbi:hypothetical protein GQ53DRAFT_354081 [Thozetella sp. PMI_491]|nr:hypothetical protein GQ53DRAFT_354081 [Thozetella sp. PMI_491]
MAPPIVVATIQSSIIGALSNILAQAITAYRNETPLVLNWVPIFQFFFYALVNTPLNFVWQDFLESTFPAMHIAPTTEAVAAASANDEKALDQEAKENKLVEPKLNLTNTVIKTLLDQTVGAVWNTFTFCTVVGGLQAAMAHNPPQGNPLFVLAAGAIRPEAIDWDLVFSKMRADFVSILQAGATFWPFVSVVNFGFVKSVQTRNLVGSLAGVAWGIYMSFVAAQ